MFFFLADRKNKDGSPCLWLRHFRLSTAEQNLTKLYRKEELNIINCVFFGLIWTLKWPSWPLICGVIAVFSSATAELSLENNYLFSACAAADTTCDWMWVSDDATEQNLTKLDRKQELYVLQPCLCFGADRNTKMDILASDCLNYCCLLWTIVGKPRPFSPQELRQRLRWTDDAEQSLTILDRRQVLGILFQVCVSGSIGKQSWLSLPLIGQDISDLSFTTA